MTNLFSSFDPMVNIIGFNIRLNWISRIIPILVLPQAYWITSSQIIKSIENIINYLHGELAAVFGLVALPGTIFTFLRFFFFIFFCNLIGLAPYIFTRSSHMSFTIPCPISLYHSSYYCSVTPKCVPQSGVISNRKRIKKRPTFHQRRQLFKPIRQGFMK